MRRKEKKRLGRERKRTNRSLKAERTATDRSMSRQGKATQRSADAARRKIRDEADRALVRERRAADQERSRRSASKGSSRDLVIERRRATQSLRRERRRADRGLELQWKRADAALREERRQRRTVERALFDRERRRTDRDLGGERQRTDAAFRASERRLSRAATDREKSSAAVAVRDEFLAIFSHDLRTPLNVIAINAARLKRMVPAVEGAEQMREVCVQIHDAIGRMTRMVDDLLDVERMSLGNLRLPRRAGDLSTVVREAAEMLAPVASERRVSLDVTLPDEPLPTRFDRERILQVLANLLGNAIKFTPPDGQVRIVAERHRGIHRVVITDTGPGVPSDQQDRIFGRFAQAGRSGGGVGLGLYIARRIVEAHGGNIGTESRPAGGGTFFFTLPATGNEAAGREKLTESEGRKQWRK